LSSEKSRAFYVGNSFGLFNFLFDFKMLKRLSSYLANWWNSKDEDTKIELSNIAERLAGILLLVIIYQLIKN
jgi:hypothetical protein